MSVTGTSAYVDPNDVVQANFGTGESNNGIGYSNEEMDQLIAEGMAATDQAERAEIYKRIQEIILEDIPWINLFIANQYEAMKDYVAGLRAHPDRLQHRPEAVLADQPVVPNRTRNMEAAACISHAAVSVTPDNAPIPRPP